MAVADDAVKASPPPPLPARIVVAVMAFVRFVLDLAPMPGLVRVVRVAAPAVIYLCLAIAWVLSACGVALVVAHLAGGEDSAPFVSIEAFTVAALKFSICIISLFIALEAVVLCLAYVTAAVSGSGSMFNKPPQNAFGGIRQQLTQVLFTFPRAVVLGLVADLAFILLSVAGILTMAMSPSVEGSMSQGERIGSVIADLGLLGVYATFCFVIIPALARHIWRDLQVDRKAGLAVVVVC